MAGFGHACATAGHGDESHVMPPANHSSSSTSNYVPSMRARRLIQALKDARKEAGLSAQQAAQRLGWTRSKLAHIEAGNTKPDAESVVTPLLELYGVASPERDALIRLARDTDRRGWWNEYRDIFADSLWAMEDEASRIREWQSQVIPGLLQIQDYAHAIIAAVPGLSQDEVRRRTQARMNRQAAFRERLRQGAVSLHSIIDEPLLHRPIGGADVRAAQLDRLIAEAERPGITIQVLPYQTGAHAGVEGSFLLLNFPEPDDPPAAYTEGVYGDVCLEAPADIRRCTVTFESLIETALDPQESAALIAAAKQ
jgi:transcriptional regulator with XRE-family HTH domain